MRPFCLIVLLTFAQSSVFGWGKDGHRLIASVAEARLTPKAKAMVRELLGANVRLADVSTCADDYRSYVRLRQKNDPAAVVPAGCLLTGDQIMAGFAHSEGWHYINIPVPSDPAHRAEVIESACRNECVTAQIERFEAELKQSTASQEKRAIALLFLTHLVGDLHQPLHTVDRDGDQGGNLVFVGFEGKTLRLHSFWDTSVVQRLGTTELKGHVDKSHKTPEEWAWEGYEIARKIVYKGIPTTTSQQAPTALKSKYVRKAEGVAQERLFAASVRLAELINEAADSAWGHPASRPDAPPRI